MKLKLLIIFSLFSVICWGQFNVASGGTNYTQDFNALTSGTWTDNTTLTGWYAKTDATASIGAYAANTGSTTTAGLYAFGVLGTNPLSDRGLGYVASNAFTGTAGTQKGYVGWRLKNTTGSPITSITVTWTGEEWRKENNASTNTLNLSYQTAATVTNLTAGTWTSAGSVFTSPIVGATAATVLDGNAPANRVAGISVTISVSVPAGDEIMLRWEDLNDAGNDHAMAVDDVTINATISGCAAPSTQASALSSNGETLDGFNVNWTSGNGNGTMIVVRPLAAANTLPSSGTAYTPNLAWAAAGQIDANNRVVFRTAGATSGTLTGLNPGAEYKVYAYEYNTTGDCYNLSSTPISAYTRALEPTAHAASFTCTTASSSQINLSFSAASTITNAAGYILLQSTTGTPTGTPTDGNFYANGTVIGDATVVTYISSAATSYNVTGLNPSTTYYFTLIPYGSYLSVPVTINYNINPTIPSSSCTTNMVVSNASDIVAVASSESATVSSTVNNPAPLTLATGVQVWQITIRDGGSSSPDADNLSTILTDIALAPSAGNQVSAWTDAINTVELFDGATRLAAGTVTTGPNRIQFTGLNVVTPDNGTKTLSLRLSLKCPLGPGALDGDDFGFSLSNANTTFSAAGSGKAAFTAATSANSQNVIAVVATKLAFTVQPSTTGVNAAMSPAVKITATDACGNLDSGFTGTVSLTSTGTMTGSPLTASAVAGVATFSGIIHTVIGSNLTMNASATGLTSATSSLFDITTITVFNPGDMAIIAVNTQAAGGSSEDEISFVSFQDILPGTTIYMTDNGYERVTAGLWGNTEGVISLTRTGSTLTKGTVVTIHTANGGVNDPTDFNVYTCGGADANWTKGVASTATTFFDLNKNDQMWIMQGGTWGNLGTGAHDATYNGNVLYGWTDIPWKTAPGYASTQGSTIYPQRECYTTDVANPIAGASQVKFNDPVNPDFSTLTNGRLDWIALINNPANWDYYVDDASYDTGGYDYIGNTTCPAMVIAGNVYVNGKWTGKQDTNWFNCGNWDTLVVPDATVDVQVGDNVYNRQAIVDAAAPFASYYGNIAQTKNLTITGEKVEVTSSTANKLEVHGNLLIDSPAGVLDMDDSNAATADGLLYLYGNWTNTMGVAFFEEGNGTVYFTGTTPQVINAVPSVGTEVYYNLVMNNDFNTAVSNDLIASNNMTINAGKNVSVDSSGYLQVNNALTNNGNVSVDDNGQFIQINETDTNAGTYTGTTFQVKRNADNIRSLDYVYWGSPLQNYDIANINGTLRFYWDTTYINPNGTEGYWLPASGNMVQGRGYIVRGPSSFTTPQTLAVTFSGKPYNGQFTYPATRGTNAASNNDNLVLVGNPYASAINADAFLAANNTEIEGAVRIWTHGTLPSSAITSPFYQNFVANYTANDYIVYNGTATTVPGVFDGKIASGQGFFVTLLESGAAAKNIVFSNSMRGNAINTPVYDNTEFFKSTASPAGSEKNRIWLDLVGPSGNVSKAVVGYVTGATMQKDNRYDAYAKLGSGLSFYSMIGNEAIHIQGRALPFDSEDRVPLGMEVPVAGNHTIAINYLDGLFVGNQGIYLEDKLLNVIHDLRANPYHFTVDAPGSLNNRFVLRFTNQTLSSSDVNAVSAGVAIYAQDGIHITSEMHKIQSVTVYDVLGRLVAEMKNVGATTAVINSVATAKSAYVVKVVLENGAVINKKIIY